MPKPAPASAVFTHFRFNDDGIEPPMAIPSWKEAPPHGRIRCVVYAFTLRGSACLLPNGYWGLLGEAANNPVAFWQAVWRFQCPVGRQECI